MTVQEEIKQIIEEDYKGYRPTHYRKLGGLHNVLRMLVTDEKFLEFLKECRIKNPKPIYKIPDEVLKQMNNGNA